MAYLTLSLTVPLYKESKNQPLFSIINKTNLN